ncbi:hypothetical protein BVRB_015380, partial [Beta vulgaris subsp. vulgaris]
MGVFCSTSYNESI